MKKTVNNFLRFFTEKKLTLSLAESMTCGLAAHQLNIARGTDEVLMGSLVCYNQTVKTTLLGVQPKLIKKYTAESKEVTEVLVRNLKKYFKTDVYAAVTGLASSGGSENGKKPVGTVFFSVMYKKQIWSGHKIFRGTPLEIKRKACEELYKFIYAKLKKTIKKN